MAEARLKIEGLQVRFGKAPTQFEAVKGLHIHLEKGECLGVVGESGSGKSVTSLALMGLLASNAEVKADVMQIQQEAEQLNLLELKESGWRQVRGTHVAMIFQEPMSSLNPVMTCGEQVTESLRYKLGLNKEAARQRCLELFAEVKLPDPEKAFNSYPHQLSGGQRQRVVIAIALSCNPEILIADEPTTALDVTVQKSILDLITELQKNRGMSVIFITHDLGVVASIAQKIAVMYRGEMIEYGTRDEVLFQPRHAYTRGLLLCRPSLRNRVFTLPSLSAVLNNETNAAQIKPRSPEDEQKQLELLDKNDLILDIQDLWVEYPGIGKKVPYQAVKGVSLNLRKGETLGLVGESGCGKSSLSRAILRLSPVKSGTIKYNNIDISQLPESEFRIYRKKMQLIFQDPYSSLNPKIRIGEAISEAMLVHGLQGNSSMRKKRTLELLEEVGLKPEWYDRYPHEFSGGQRQRIVIARALAVEPEFLICDESVAALDVSVQAQVLNLLQDLKSRYGLSMIFISHDLSVIAHMSNRIAVMYGGQIEESGPTEAIVSHPKSAYTLRLIKAIPEL
jgi:peptide/nickel transport system ATP-binding protein